MLGATILELMETNGVAKPSVGSKWVVLYILGSRHFMSMEARQAELIRIQHYQLISFIG